MRRTPPESRCDCTERFTRRLTHRPTHSDTFARMNAINRIAHYFPADISVLFRDFRAHVDGFVLIEQDELCESSARVEVFETELVEPDHACDDPLTPPVAASMIPIRCGQRFRVWSRDNGPVKLCFLPTDRPHEMISVDLFKPR